MALVRGLARSFVLPVGIKMQCMLPYVLQHVTDAVLDEHTTNKRIHAPTKTCGEINQRASWRRSRMNIFQGGSSRKQPFPQQSWLRHSHPDTSATQRNKQVAFACFRHRAMLLALVCAHLVTRCRVASAAGLALRSQSALQVLANKFLLQVPCWSFLVVFWRQGAAAFRLGYLEPILVSR